MDCAVKTGNFAEADTAPQKEISQNSKMNNPLQKIAEDLCFELYGEDWKKRINSKLYYEIIASALIQYGDERAATETERMSTWWNRELHRETLKMKAEIEKRDAIVKELKKEIEYHKNGNYYLMWRGARKEIEELERTARINSDEQKQYIESLLSNDTSEWKSAAFQKIKKLEARNLILENTLREVVLMWQSSHDYTYAQSIWDMVHEALSREKE